MNCILSLILVNSVIISLTWSQANWELITVGPWSPREGVMGCVYNNYVYLSGGRLSTTFGANQTNTFFNDVYRINGSCQLSSQSKQIDTKAITDNNCEWELITDNAPWHGRAYHIMFTHAGYMYIMAGQNYSSFYNDIWRSTDGSNWEQILTNKYINHRSSNISSYKQFEQRAGLAAVSYNNNTIYVMGGCENNYPDRILYNDVWLSNDNGYTWLLLFDKSSWKPRSGARIQIYNNILYLAAGEYGFSGPTQYDDVWKLDLTTISIKYDNYLNRYIAYSNSDWEEITNNPGWDKRSGHGFSIDENTGYFWIIAGYFDKHDLWLSKNLGSNWTMARNDVFNCNSQSCGRYDFWSLIYENYLIIFGGDGDYSTFGGAYNETWRLDLTDF